MKPLRGLELKKHYKQNKHTKEIYIILENIQYARNVASVFRTSDAIQVKKIFLTGISKTPPFGKDLVKASRHKEKSIPWEYSETTGKVIQKLARKGIETVALEITDNAVDYRDFDFPDRVAILVGNEGYGVTKNTLSKLEKSVYLPMFGKGASLNVSISLAVCLYEVIR